MGGIAFILPRNRLPSSLLLGSAASFVFQFVQQNFGPILRVLWLPTLIQALILYFSLHFYFSELVVYLLQPDRQIAAQALGILAAGLFSALFFAGVAIVGLAELAAGKRTQGGWLYLRISRPEWRFFAASVLLLVTMIFLLGAVALMGVTVANVAGLLPGEVWSLGFGVGGPAAMVGLFYLFLRFGFLIPPLVVAGHEKILRQSWRLSAKSWLQLGALILLLAAPAITSQAMGDFLLRASGVLSSDMVDASVAALVRSTLDVFPYVLILSMVSYVLAVVPLTVGAQAAYSGIVDSRMTTAP